MQKFFYYVKKYGKDVVVFLLLIICIGLMVYNTFVKRENVNEPINELALSDLTMKKEESMEENSEQNNFKIHIDVKGAVKKPGVYEVDNNTIINDVIKLAGGFTSNAYQNGINLSKKVTDEMVIYVYTKTEIKKYEEDNSTLNVVSNESCTTPNYNIYECVSDKESIIEIGENSSKDDNNQSDSKIVNINTASVQELMTLTGVGESKAQAIIKYREENGKFNNINEIMNVSGIGEKAFEKIKDFITI